MNKKFVALSVVTWTRIRGCFSEPRCDLSVTRGWQQMMNAIEWIELLAENNQVKVCRAYLKETEAQQTATPWHRHCHCINNANSSPLDRLNRFCLIFL